MKKFYDGVCEKNELKELQRQAYWLVAKWRDGLRAG